MEPPVRTILAELRQALEALYGPRLLHMVLYGSQARGEAVEGSDIDVLVVLEGPVSPGEEISRTGTLVADLSLEHDVVVSCLFASAERYAEERSPWLMNIRREGITV